MTFEVKLHIMKISVFIMLSFVESFGKIRYETKFEFLNIKVSIFVSFCILIG